MALTDVLGGLQTLVAAVSGIKAAPTYMRDQLAPMPFCVAYPKSGTYEMGALGAYQVLHSIVLELHIPFVSLEASEKAALQYADTVPQAILADPTFGGTIDTFGGISYTFGMMRWGGFDTIGFRWTIEDVKCIIAI